MHKRPPPPRDRAPAPPLGLLSLALAIAFGAGCASSSGHPPTARISASPLFIPAGDAGRTDVHLDATASDDSLDDPAREKPLRFHWDLDDPDARVTTGSLDAATLTVRLSGARPTTVRLTVTDDGGDTGSARVEIGITLFGPDLGASD